VTYLSLSLPLDIIRAIATYGFSSSPYPVIVSLYTHCSLDQQEMAVDIISEELGPMLQLPVDGFSAPLTVDNLQYRVLVEGGAQPSESAISESLLSIMALKRRAAGRSDPISSGLTMGDVICTDEERLHAMGSDVEELNALLTQTRYNLMYVCMYVCM
jgi:hypothetical protein